MSAEAHRGATPVTRLEALPALEQAAIVQLRLWCSGPEHRAELWNAYATAFGGAEGARHLKAVERFVGLLATASRRPVVHHCVDCLCVGADEAAVAALVSAAAEGAREDACLLASLLVRPDMALPMADAAAEAGLALRRLALRAARPNTPRRSTHRTSALPH